MMERQKILIVDNKKENLVALRLALREVDAEVIEAANGNDALVVMLAHEFAVAILDVQMPGMDGYELAGRMNREHKTPRIPIVFLTANQADERHWFRGGEAGGIDYISRPYSSKILIGKVKVFLEMDQNRRAQKMSSDRLETMLDERVKELECLYAISRLVLESRDSIGKLLQAAVALIPSGLRCPEIMCARIVYQDREFASANFRTTDWRQCNDIILSEKTVGTMEVCYLEKTPAGNDGLFLKNELEMLAIIAGLLGMGIEHKLTEDKRREKTERLRVHQIEMAIQNEELRRAQVELNTARSRYFDLYDSAPIGYCTLSEQGVIQEANITAATLLGVVRNELVRQSLSHFILKENQDIYHLRSKQFFETGKPQECELRIQKKDGRAFWAHLSFAVVKNIDHVPVCRVMLSDITRHKQEESQQRLAKDVLAILNQSNNSKDIFRDILLMIKAEMGIEAVGIRLKAGGDFPYYQTTGFPDRFVQLEKSLCAHDLAGQLRLDGQGKPILECMCGNVICGRTDPKQPFFTAAGSFWTNSTTELLASTTEAERQAHTRNRCHGEGYESMALIPLRAGNETIGLLQLNDHQRNQFTLKLILFLEGLGASIGIALSRMRTAEQLVEARNDWADTFDSITDMVTVHDRDFNIIQANQAAKKILGLPLLEKAAGAKCFACYHDAEKPLPECPTCVCITSGQPATFELFEPHLNRHLEIRALPRFNRDHHVIGLIHVVRDITEHKQTEEKIKNQLQELLRWQEVMLGREDRVQRLKREVNGLCHRLGEPVHYPSQSASPADAKDAGPKP